MNTKTFTEKKLISLFKTLEQKIGIQPTKKQWNEDVNTPSDMPVRQNFGNWTNFLNKMNLVPLKVIPIGARKGHRNKKGVSKVLNKYGYYEIFEPTHPLAKKNGYIREHRLIAYDAGILTDPKMEIHHINNLKTDNRIDNFMVLTKAQHASLTWKNRARNAQKRNSNPELLK